MLLLAFLDFFEVDSDRSLKVLNCQCRFPGIFLFKLAYSQDSRALAANLLLIFWHRPRYFTCHQLHIFPYCQP